MSTTEHYETAHGTIVGGITSSTEIQDPKIVVLGQRLTLEKLFGPPIEKNIALRWREVLNNGLPKEEQLQLLEKYQTPESCKEINTPVLNSEVMVAMQQGAMAPCRRRWKLAYLRRVRR